MPQELEDVGPSGKGSGYSTSGRQVGNILSTAAKEIVPIVMAAALWGHKWWGKVVLFVSDNEPILAVLNSGCTRDGILMHLLQCSSLQHHSDFSTVHATSRADLL